MGTRRERVILELDDQFTTGMARATVATSLLKDYLDSLSSSAVRSRAPLAATSRDIDKVGASSRTSGAEIDKLSGRLRLLGATVGAFGPGAVAGVAALTPVLAGLSAQAGFAVASAGVLVTAFQGVGDALEAVGKYQAEPTAENLEAATEAMKELSPAAQAAVLRMRELAPVLKEIRDSAAGGFFPGFVDGLDDFERLAPTLERIFGTIAGSTGDLFADGMASLASDEWEGVFYFIEAEAAPAVDKLGRTVGNVTKGLAELLMAMDPLSDDFTNGLLKASENFEAWAENLTQTDGYAEFIAYVRETGPQVLETLGSLANMFLQIAEAAAPLGGPVLQILELLADTIAAIADSPLGPPIMTMVTALSALSLAAKVAQGAMSGLNASMLAGFGGPAARSGSGAASARVRTFASDLAFLATSAATAGARTERELKRIDDARRRTLMPLARGGALAAGGGAAVAGSMMGGQFAALGATIGLIGGPWGAAILGGVGLLTDFAMASDRAADSQAQFNERLAALSATGDVSGMRAMRDEVLASVADYEKLQQVVDAFQNTDVGTGGLPEQVLGLTEQFSEGKLSEYQGQLDSINEELENYARATGLASGEEALAVLQTQERTRALLAQGDSIGILIDSMKNLDDTNITTAKSAEMFGAALDAMIAPKMNRAAQINDWHQAINGFADSLAENNRSLKGFSEGALQNQDAVAGMAGQLINLAKAQATAGAGSRRVGRTLTDGIEAIVKTGKAAGLSEPEIRRYLRTLGLTPKLKQTLFKTLGIPKAEVEVRALIARYQKIPKQIRSRVETYVKNHGVPKTQAELDAMKAKIKGLTNKQLKTIIGVETGMAKAGVNNVKAWLKKLDADAKKKREINVETSQANKDVNALKNNIASVQGKDVTITVHERTVKESALGNFFPAVRAFAGGGMDVANGHQPEMARGGAWRVWAEPETGGETYIPHANDHRRPAAKQYLEQTASLFGGEVTWYANGGTRGGRAGAADELTGALKESAKAAREEARARKEALKEQKQELLQRKRDLASSVTDKLRTNIWEAPGDVWGQASTMSWRDKLRADIAQARQFRKAQRQLAAKGLGGAAAADLFENADPDTVRAMAAGMSRAEVRQYERLFNTRQRLTGAAGRAAGQQAYGDRLDRIERLLRKANEHHKDGPGKTGREVGRAVNGGAAAGSRRGRR